MPARHPTAVIDPRARIDASVEIQPFVVVDGAAEIAAGCVLEAHSQIIGDVKIGAGTRIGRAAIIGGPPQDLGFDPATPSGVQIGADCVIREHVTIHRATQAGGVTRIGDKNFLMAGCHLGHDTELGDENIIANAALLAGHVQVGNRTFIGGGAVFHQFLRIGDGCVVQGNGSFSRDIPHYCKAQRVNLLAGLNVVGLRRQGFSADERAEIKRLYQLLFLSGRNLSQALEEARRQQWGTHATRLLEFVAAPSRKGVCSSRRSAAGRDE
jgi:UDP-N-acetylglucosamine acyltransferase